MTAQFEYEDSLNNAFRFMIVLPKIRTSTGDSIHDRVTRVRVNNCPHHLRSTWLRRASRGGLAGKNCYFYYLDKTADIFGGKKNKIVKQNLFNNYITNKVSIFIKWYYIFTVIIIYASEYVIYQQCFIIYDYIYDYYMIIYILVIIVAYNITRFSNNNNKDIRYKIL